MSKSLNKTRFRAPVLTLQEPDEMCCARFSISIGAFCSVASQRDTKTKPAAVLVDNFAPTRGFMKEFNRNDVKCCAVTRLIGVRFLADFPTTFPPSSRAPTRDLFTDAAFAAGLRVGARNDEKNKC
jgi:hypothetical protein